MKALELQIKEKSIYFIVTCGVLCATGIMEAGEVKNLPEFKQAYEMGKAL